MAQSIFMYLFFFPDCDEDSQKIFKSLSDTFGDKGNKIIFKNFINVVSLNAGHCITAADQN